jgi:uncharacterized membrane protein
METHKRSIIKTVSWRVTGSTSTFLITYSISGSITLAGVIGITQILTNSVLYYAHERVWNKINWGNHNPEDNCIRGKLL